MRDIDVGAAQAAASKIRKEKDSIKEAKAKLQNCIQIISETNDNSATDITLAAIEEVMAKIKAIESNYDSVASGIVSEAQKIHQEYLDWKAAQEEAERKRKERETGSSTR